MTLVRSSLIVWLGLAAAAQAQPEPWRPELTPEVIQSCLGDDPYGIYVNRSKCGWARIKIIKFDHDGGKPMRVHGKLTFELRAVEPAR